MKLFEIINILEENFPKNTAYEWDNPGLFYGNRDKEIKKILTTLDITVDVVKQAIEDGCDMILSHHPFTMKGLKTLADESMHSKMTELIIKNDIAIFSAHTNMDIAQMGINQKSAELLGLKNIEIMEINHNFEGIGLGRVGDLEKVTSLFDLCQLVKDKLHTPFVRVSGEDRIIKRVAYASGSCAEFIPDAIKKGADVIITADIKYHEAINSVYDGIAIIDAGHFPTEIIVCEIFSEILSKYDVEVKSAKQEDIFIVK